PFARRSTPGIWTGWRRCCSRAPRWRWSTHLSSTGERRPGPPCCPACVSGVPAWPLRRTAAAVAASTRASPRAPSRPPPGSSSGTPTESRSSCPGTSTAMAWMRSAPSAAWRSTRRAASSPVCGTTSSPRRSSPRCAPSSASRTGPTARSAAASGRCAERSHRSGTLGRAPARGARETGVRIAVSGTHRAGKSTLVEDLAARLRGYRILDEPYHLLEEEGFELGDPPSMEDWLAQLRRSLEELEGDDSPDLLLDRCPLDLLAYARVDEDRDALDLEEWMPRVREAMETLDLVVFVPIEHPDPVPLGAGEDARLRGAVDRALTAMLLEDSLGLDLEVVT